MDLGKAARDGASVEVRRIDPVGVQSTCGLEAEVDKALVFGLEVVHEVGDVVEPLLAPLVHIAVDRRGVVVLHDQLDHEIAQIAEGVRHVGLVRRGAVGERVALVVLGDCEGSSPERLAPPDDRFVEVIDEIGMLEERVAGEGRHGRQA